MRSPEARENRGERLRAEVLGAPWDRLRPLHVPKLAPHVGDWLSAHPEPGQSFEEYRRRHPVRPEGDRRFVYLQPLGPFTPVQSRVVDATVAWIEAWFGLPVRRLDPLPLSAVPDHARRVHPTWGIEQLHTRFILGELLAPRRPDDAVALIALTAADLYPDPDWNFVFGQASLGARVGVWSLYRSGDPTSTTEAFRLCLRRTAATAVHELGHMLSMAHCTAWECAMNGSNSRAEADARPMWLCPQCLAKLCWNVGCDPAARFERLRAQADRDGFEDEAAYWRRAARALGPG